MSGKKILISILAFGAVVAFFNGILVHGPNFSDKFLSERNLKVSYEEIADVDVIDTDLNKVHPFKRMTIRLDEFNWDPILIDAAARKYWNMKMSLIVNKQNKDGENTTVLSSSGYHTSPWIVTTLLQLKVAPYSWRGIFLVPDNKSLVVSGLDHAPKSCALAVKPRGGLMTRSLEYLL